MEQESVPGKPSITTARPPSGPLFGRYELLEKLGEGGMAEVYLARVHGLQGFSRLIALKLVHAHLAAQKTFSQWFISEARLGGRLNHPNVVKALEFGELDGRLFIELEYVDGPTLAQVLAFHRRERAMLPPDVALRLASQLCRALGYIHRATDHEGRPLGLIHRDVKPSNIFVSRHGEIKLGDFGIARSAFNATQTQVGGSMKGTLGYMSPEQARGKLKLDNRLDLFCAGIVLFEMLTLKPLYEAPNEMALIRLAQDARVGSRLELLPELPCRDNILKLLEKALSRSPRNRFGSGEELEEALEELLAGYPQRTRLEPWIESLSVRMEAIRPPPAILELSGVEAASEAGADLGLNGGVPRTVREDSDHTGELSEALSLAPDGEAVPRTGTREDLIWEESLSAADEPPASLPSQAQSGGEALETGARETGAPGDGETTGVSGDGTLEAGAPGDGEAEALAPGSQRVGTLEAGTPDDGVLTTTVLETGTPDDGVLTTTVLETGTPGDGNPRVYASLLATDVRAPSPPEREVEAQTESPLQPVLLETRIIAPEWQVSSSTDALTPSPGLAPAVGPETAEVRFEPEDDDGLLNAVKVATGSSNHHTKAGSEPADDVLELGQLFRDVPDTMWGELFVEGAREETGEQSGNLPDVLTPPTGVSGEQSASTPAQSPPTGLPAHPPFPPGSLLPITLSEAPAVVPPPHLPALRPLHRPRRRAAVAVSVTGLALVGLWSVFSFDRPTDYRHLPGSISSPGQPPGKESTAAQVQQPRGDVPGQQAASFNPIAQAPAGDVLPVEPAAGQPVGPAAGQPVGPAAGQSEGPASVQTREPSRLQAPPVQGPSGIVDPTAVRKRAPTPRNETVIFRVLGTPASIQVGKDSAPLQKGKPLSSVTLPFKSGKYEIVFDAGPGTRPFTYPLEIDEPGSTLTCTVNVQGRNVQCN